MLAAHVFIQYLEEIAGWQEARHEAPVQRIRDVQKVTIPGREWLNPLPNPRKQEPYDFILRALIEQLASSGQRKISIAEANMKKRIVYDSEIAGFAAMGTRQVTYTSSQAGLCVTNNEKTNPSQRRNLHAVDSWSFEASWQ